MTDQVHTPPIDQAPPPAPDDTQQPGYMLERVYGRHERRTEELINKAWQVSGGRYDGLPDDIKNKLNWYIWWRSKHHGWASVFGYAAYRAGDVFKDDDYQVYFDQLSDNDKRSLLRQAICTGHAHGPDVDVEVEAAGSPARTGNLYIIASFPGQFSRHRDWLARRRKC